MFSSQNTNLNKNVSQTPTPAISTKSPKPLATLYKQQQPIIENLEPFNDKKCSSKQYAVTEESENNRFFFNCFKF